MSYSIYLVDDHDLIRGGLQSLIEEGGIFKVTEQFGNGQELISKIQSVQAPPDVIVLDLEMPVMNGKETLQQLYSMSPDYKVLILTISGGEDTVLDMVRNGARGFLPKYCSRQELCAALTEIIESGYYRSEHEIKVLYESVKKSGTAARENRQAAEAILTARELEFIRLVCDPRELPYKLIADEMNVTLRTVDGYRESVFLKADIKSKAGLVMYALRQGILQLKDI